jgi:hypothetical protein
VVGSGGTVSIPSRFAFLRHSLAGLVILFATFFGAILLMPTTETGLPEGGQIRLVINHGGEVAVASDELSAEILEKLPENVDPAQVMGGARLPVRLRVAIDGKQVIEESYEARGLRQEGSIYGAESQWVVPGEHAVQVWLMDDEVEWRLVFDDTVTVAEDSVVRLLYNAEHDVFEE